MTERTGRESERERGRRKRVGRENASIFSYDMESLEFICIEVGMSPPILPQEKNRKVIKIHDIFVYKTNTHSSCFDSVIVSNICSKSLSGNSFCPTIAIH